MALFLLCFGKAVLAETPVDSPVILFDIPAGDAQQTLLQFVSQSNIEMLYSSDDVRGVITHPVAGDMTVSEALGRMIEGTGLEMSFEGNYTFASIRPTQRRNFDPNAAENERRLRPWFSRVPQTKPDGAPIAEPLEEVVITGTLLHGTGVQAIMSPVVHVEREEVRHARSASVQEVLRTLPLNHQAAQSEYYTSAGNYIRGVAANLRGLGAGATLVLVNGHRQVANGNDGDFVDLTGIPWAAVERIEVLPDGASALYGSDAIAGVINIIMRKDRSANESTLRYSFTPAGAPERLLSHLGAFDWSSGHALIAYQYDERGVFAASDRSYSANADQRARGGDDFRSTRSSPGNILDPATLAPVYGIPEGGAHSVEDLTTPNLLNRNATLDVLPRRRTHSGYVSFVQSLSDLFELTLDSRLSTRSISQMGPGFEQTLPVPSTNPHALNPFQQPTILVGYSFLHDLGPVTLNATSVDSVTTGSVKTRFGETWHGEFSGTYGQEHSHFVMANQVDPARFRAAISDPNAATALNLFGPTNSDTLESLRYNQFGQSVSRLTSATAIADGNVLSTDHVLAKLAVGAEWRREGLERSVPAIGAFARTVTSGFAELAVPIAPAAESLNSYPRLELSLAARGEHYSDFGSTVNPKFGFKWAPTQEIKVRGSVGTSFSAPTLVDRYDAGSKFAGQGVFPDPRAQNGHSVVLFLGGANPDLREQRSTTWTAGLDFAPMRAPDLKASITYYAVNYHDQVVRPGPPQSSDILLQEAQWASVINRTPTQADIDAICDSPYYRGSPAQCKATRFAAIIDYRNRNLASTDVRGIDGNVEQRIEFATGGEITWNVRSAYILKFRQKATASAAAIDVLDTIGNPLSLKSRASLSWQEHAHEAPGWGASVGIDYAGAYRDRNDGRRIEAFTSFDLSLSFRTSHGIEAWLDLSNVFNTAPPAVNREIGYDLANGDPYGRLATFMIRKSW